MSHHSLFQYILIKFNLKSPQNNNFPFKSTEDAFPLHVVVVPAIELLLLPLVCGALSRTPTSQPASWLAAQFILVTNLEQ